MDVKNKIKFIYNYLKEHGIINFFLLFLLKLKNHRGKLARKYIKGVGVEIGAGGNPLKVNTGVIVKYVDYLPNKDLQEINEAFKQYKTVKIDYVCDANDLSNLGNNSQDFIIANHVFEHLRNPLQSLVSRYNVLKNDGIIFLTVPDKRKTFDKHREITSLEHIIKDYEQPSKERDFEHFLEFAEISLKEKKGNHTFSKEDILNEAKHLLNINYSIHYHVFIEKTVENIIEYGNKNKVFCFDIIDKKSTIKNRVHNEFILILKCKKN